ncbi:hypothetical protein [Saccharibacillus sp. JS10]|uniref:hypothetical protein n=1 Tax=Saccharibacillus sp. JS10 TaxID=2950552 RepID=UPI00210C11CC|nr:hypothetical protein [Saccharibacillus sp. JS10]MCQ4088449.1 hypothetical protein [Saccharibacillus sp. JS10]
MIITTLITSGIPILAFGVSIITLRNLIITRRTSVKPLFIPSRIKEFVNDDNLFACNFEYPITEDCLGEPKLVFFGIKNIGKGSANNVRVLKFYSQDQEPHIFRVGSNSIRIPEGISIPFVIRVARADEIEYSYATYVTTIIYEDIFGNEFFLNIRLWINNNEVAVIEYNDLKEPKWREFDTVVWREVESNGFFETRKLEEELKLDSK